jgi:hypothetical protein
VCPPSFAFVKKDFQTQKICFEAIIREPRNITFVWNQTYQLCLKAVNLNKKCLDYIHNKNLKQMIAIGLHENATDI